MASALFATVVSLNHQNWVTTSLLLLLLALGLLTG
jgi:hypothetical protein